MKVDRLGTALLERAPAKQQVAVASCSRLHGAHIAASSVIFSFYNKL